VLLYEPRHASARLPLSLLHVAAALDARVAIVDGRLEMAPAALVAELAKEALCLGVTTPTGPPLADAVEVTRAARAVCPRLPVLWGGPHATFRPAECLATGLVDACVMGAGERTFAEIVAALRAGGTDTGVPGVAWLRGQELAQSPPRPREDVNDLPQVDYTLVDLEHYFRFRGARRAEVSTSRGSSEGQDWSGLVPVRVVGLVEDLARRHRVQDITFTDQGFFVDPVRAAAIATGLLASGVGLGWEASANLRDLVASRGRLDWTLLRESGCRRIRLFAEAADGEAMAEEVARLVEAGVAVHVVFIVGRPGEPPGAARDAYKAARGLRHRGGLATVEMRLFEPWPGREDGEKAAGPKSPTDLAGWSAFEPQSVSSAWISSSVRRCVPRWSFYLGRASARPGRRLAQRLVHRLARARVRLGFYGLDLDRRVVLGLHRLKAALTLRAPLPVED
jgi:radical SAM superfamily enzyme YgiQ (UPF0313 family)